MAILPKQTMLEKEMFLKKINKFMGRFIYLFFLLTLFIFFTESAMAESKKKLNNYFQNLNNFSSSFIQSENINNSEGLLHKNNSRIKIEYLNPTNIEIIISKNKGMYFNKDLSEVEFFNPKNSVGEILYNIFLIKIFYMNQVLFLRKVILL